MRPSSFLPALFCTTLVSAWSWPENAADVGALLKAYQDKRDVVLRDTDTTATSADSTDVITTSDSSTATATTTTDTSSKKTDTTTDASSAAAASSSGSKVATSTDSKKSSGSATSTQSTSTSSVSISSNAAAGGASMITPNTASTTSYYKVGNNVTFAWNYTSLSVTPTAIDIMASCSVNSALYTIALNQSVSATTGAVTWDTGDYQATATQQLLTGTYTLIIYDAAKSFSASASPGYFDTFDSFTFGMYTPQPYTPLSEWVCATCSGALSQMERQTLGFLALMATITILSFTGFLGGAGLLF